MFKLLKFKAIPLSLGLVLLACGHINFGSSQTLNEPAPVGQIAARGAFPGGNGAQSVAGSVLMYVSDSTNKYVIRFEGLEAPEETGLYVLARTTTGSEFRTPLRAVRGSQNYPIDVESGTVTWAAVSIENTARFIYSTATLQ